MGDVAALFRNADCGQAKPGGRDACDDAGVVDADIAAIFDQSGLRIGLLPEEEETAAFQIVQKLIILRRKGGLAQARVLVPRRLVSSLCGLPVPTQEEAPLSERQTERDAGHLAQQPAPGSDSRSTVICDLACDSSISSAPFIHAHSGRPHLSRQLKLRATLCIE